MPTFKRKTNPKKRKPIKLISKRDSYSRRYLPPLDKIYLRTKKRCNLEKLKENATDIKQVKYKRPFKFQAEYSAILIFNEKQITFYSNDYETEIQINPSQWESWQSVCSFLETIAPLGEFKVHRLHINVDIPFDIVDVRKGLFVPRISKLGVFGAETTIKKSGRIQEVEFTAKYGSEKTKCLALYDAVKKHKHLDLPNPTTRIEWQFNANHTSPIKKPSELPNLLGMGLFKSLELKQLRCPDGLSNKTQRMYWELIKEKADRVGLKAAISDVCQMDIKHSYTVIKQIRDLMKPMAVDLESDFVSNLKTFLEKEPSSEEKKLISDILTSTAISKLESPDSFDHEAVADSHDGSLTTEYEEVLTAKEAAEYLKISHQSLLNMTSNGKIPFYKLGRRNRYRTSDLKQLLLDNHYGPEGGVNGNQKK